MSFDDDDEVFGSDDNDFDVDYTKKNASKQSLPIAFSFTGIPMSRLRSSSVTRGGPSKPRQMPAEGGSATSAVRDVPAASASLSASRGERTARTRRHSLGNLTRSQSGSINLSDRTGSYEPSQHNPFGDSKPVHRGRPPTRGTNASSVANRPVPVRSASCARLTERRQSAASGSAMQTTAPPSETLANLPLRQSVKDLRRSVHDLSSCLGFHQPSFSTMEDLHNRMQADWEAMRRQSARNTDASTFVDGGGDVHVSDSNQCFIDDDYDEDENEIEEELLQLGPKTAVVPPFSVTAPCAASSDVGQDPLQQRPGTPSRIPVPRPASPRPTAVLAAKTGRSQSVCLDNFSMTSNGGPATKVETKPDKPALARRNSYDVKISTPLVTGRSSIIGSARMQANGSSRCFRPARKQKQPV